ncbi:MAG: class I SAM-dependent methyltransferase [Clostridia bacterium]|nr:class I SAM-dependent methyltransferase [Clostridia bacterium]
MSDHYYTQAPESESHPRRFTASPLGKELAFWTDAGVFSKGEVDKGTALLLENLPPLQGRVLDLGCGWGAVGVTLKAAQPHLNVVMCDVNQRALDLTRRNLQENGLTARVLLSDGLAALAGETFEAVVSNPPIRAGKQVIYDLFRQSFDHLTPGGRLFLVIRKQQGAESAIAYLKTFFQEVVTLKKGGGFWIIQCTKG